MATTATSTSTSALPAYLQQALQQILSQGQQVAQQPYQTYGGPRVAGFTPLQQQAFNQTASNVGSYKPALSAASSLYGQTGQLFNNADFQQFMNPYNENVVNQIATLGNRNLLEKILPNINDTFTGAGQFGSRRNYDLTNRAIRDTQEGISAAQGEALFNSNKAAMGDYEQALGRLGNTATGLQGLAGNQQQLEGNDVSRLAAAGQQQQDLTQNNYNLAYQDFLKQLNYPKEQLNWLTGLTSGQPIPTNTTQTTTTPTPSTSNSLLTLAGLGGLNYLGSGNNASELGNWFSGLFAKGGKAAKKPMYAKRPMEMGINGMRLGVV